MGNLAPIQSKQGLPVEQAQDQMFSLERIIHKIYLQTFCSGRTKNITYKPVEAYIAI